MSRLDAYLEALYPPESNHILGVEALLQPHVRFVHAVSGGVLVGCGAVLLYPEEYAEIKRMFVVPECRGRGVGMQILRYLEELAAAAGCRFARLETGIYQPEAIHLYERAGYRVIEAFGSYTKDPLSVFYEKRLVSART